jgi:hypothetical protein
MKMENEVKGLKPFDLEKALKGEKVITRDGREVSEVHHFKTVTSRYTVSAVISGRNYSFTRQGVFISGMESEDDLFMAPKERVVWVNIYRNGTYGPKHETQKYADLAAHGYERLGNRAYPITIEED